MATMALVGVSPLAAAAEHITIERNNVIEQNNEQEQNACTNELEVEEEDKGDQEAIVVADQDNTCAVVQAQANLPVAAIADFSINDISVIIAELLGN